MFQIGDLVTPKSKGDANFGEVGRVVGLHFEEVFVEFDGLICLYFKWMLRDA